MLKFNSLYTNYQELLLDLKINAKILTLSVSDIDSLKEELKIKHQLEQSNRVSNNYRYTYSRKVSDAYEINYASTMEFQAGEELLDLWGTSERQERIEPNFVLKQEYIDLFSYERNPNDTEREKIISSIIGTDLEDFKRGIKETESLYGSVRTREDTVLSDNQIDNLGTEPANTADNVFDDDGIELDNTSSSVFDDGAELDNASSSVFDDDGIDINITDKVENTQTNNRYIQSEEEKPIPENTNSEEIPQAVEEQIENEQEIVEDVEEQEEDVYDEIELEEEVIDTDDSEIEDSEEEIDVYEEEEVEEEIADAGDSEIEDSEEEIENSEEETEDSDEEIDAYEEDEIEEEVEEDIYEEEEEVYEEEELEEEVEESQEDDIENDEEYEEDVGDDTEVEVEENVQVNKPEQPKPMSKQSNDDFFDPDLDDIEVDFITPETNQGRGSPEQKTLLPVEKPKQEVQEVEEEPTDIRQFLRKHPNSDYDFVLKYFSKRQIEDSIRVGKIVRVRNKLKA